MQTLATGIFMWDRLERVSDRYGIYYPHEKNFNEDVNFDSSFDKKLANSLLGKNVKISCHVLETRQSGHIGDFCHGLYPSTPEVGEIIELGIGPFYMEKNEYSKCECAFGIKPSDGRESWWTNPEKLYRLHDQTVEFLIEETDEPETVIKKNWETNEEI